MNIEGLGCGKGFGSLRVKHSLLLLLFWTKSSQLKESEKRIAFFQTRDAVQMMATLKHFVHNQDNKQARELKRLYAQLENKQENLTVLILRAKKRGLQYQSISRVYVTLECCSTSGDTGTVLCTSTLHTTLTTHQLLYLPHDILGDVA